jgi:hypothetical protein
VVMVDGDTQCADRDQMRFWCVYHNAGLVGAPSRAVSVRLAPPHGAGDTGDQEQRRGAAFGRGTQPRALAPGGAETCAVRLCYAGPCVAEPSQRPPSQLRMRAATARSFSRRMTR